MDYQPSQELAGKFTDISAEEFATAVQWVGADGERLSGAEAVLAALATSTWSGRTARPSIVRTLSLPAWPTLLMPGVARHRVLFPRLTGLL